MKVIVTGIVVSRCEASILRGVVVTTSVGNSVTIPLNGSSDDVARIGTSNRYVDCHSLGLEESGEVELYMGHQVLTREVVNIITNMYGTYLSSPKRKK